MQWLLTILAVSGAAAYAFRRIRKTMKQGDSPCLGCQMKKNCQKFGQSKEM